ncbi:carbohydrate kinase family protein [Paenibacillus elgii]|uniref:carbohydrate kinase family protein n=1 Tax=Paenibacillus elgii TaxID=189691 RepID=UPI000FDA1927|nr:sugar kinase [Paenibacillus elgii]NEN83588.1 sugar kinase [Paenibacillus elgii]
MFEFKQVLDFEDRQNDVLMVGELLIDLISADYEDAFEGAAYHKFFGGSPANIAMNVKKLGGRSQIAAAVGEDRLGMFLINHLRIAGIEPEYVETVENSTSLVLLTKSKSTPVPVFYRSADYQISYTSKLEEALLRSKILHFSCWPISMLPARDTIGKMLDLAAKQNVLIGFDPNYHPVLWQQGEDGAAYVKSIIGKVDIIKPSGDDAERLFGKDTPYNHIKKFLSLGAKLVILTLGKYGAIVSNGSETVTFKTLATEVVDTTGAGDAFWSGFYTALVKGYSIHEAISLGFAVSAYKLKYTGAVVDLPELEAIKNLYEL